MNHLFRKSASIASLVSKHTRAALISVESFRSSPASISTEDVKDFVFNGEIRSFSCSEFLVKNGFGLGVRGFHFSAPPLEFRASIVTKTEFAAVDDFYDEERPSGKKVGGESDAGLEIAKLGISPAIVTALASKGIMKLFPIQDNGDQTCYCWFKYYSMYGHVEKLAEEIKKGVASVECVEAKLWQIWMLEL